MIYPIVMFNKGFGDSLLYVAYLQKHLFFAFNQPYSLLLARHAAAWRQQDSNPGPPDTKPPLYICAISPKDQ